MPGKHSRNKGAAYEREIVNCLKDNGIKAERIPLSGAMKGNYSGDIKLGPVLGYIGECKRTKKKLTHIYKALEQDNADFLFARDDLNAWLNCLMTGMKRSGSVGPVVW